MIDRLKLVNDNVQSFWLDRPIFVTGATGMIGSWLLNRLLAAGSNVACLVRDFVPQSELIRSRLIEQVRVVRGDICDQKLLERILGEYEIDTVFHLAAQTIVGIANRNPVSTFKANIEGTWTLLEACRHSPTVKRIVVASSDKAYGDLQRTRCDENVPLQGRFPYDVSKACTDLIARSYAFTYELPVVITRCANFYGGGDLNWNRIVPGTIRSVLRGYRPIIRSDGNNIRDYLYIEDAAKAYMLLAEHMLSMTELCGEAFNFSSELQITVLELVQRILALMDSDLEPDIRNEAKNEIRDQYLSAAKARRILGWSPEFTLDEGLMKTISWYKEYFTHGR